MSGQGQVCGVAGCKTSSGHLPYMRKHRSRPHYACSCGGFVGPYPKMHLAHVLRRGEDENDHEITQVS